MQTGTGFWASKILLAAVNFQLFTRLAEKKLMTAQQIKMMLNLKCTDRKVYDFLDARKLQVKGLIHIVITLAFLNAHYLSYF